MVFVRAPHGLSVYILFRHIVWRCAAHCLSMPFLGSDVQLFWDSVQFMERLQDLSLCVFVSSFASGFRDRICSWFIAVCRSLALLASGFSSVELSGLELSLEALLSWCRLSVREAGCQHRRLCHLIRAGLSCLPG